MNVFNIFVNSSNLIILACILSVSIISGGKCFAQSYWDAIFELGYEPITQRVNHVLACRRIEGIHRFRELIFDHLTADQNLLIKLKNLNSRITSLL